MQPSTSSTSLSSLKFSSTESVSWHSSGTVVTRRQRVQLKRNQEKPIDAKSMIVYRGRKKGTVEVKNPIENRKDTDPIELDPKRCKHKKNNENTPIELGSHSLVVQRKKKKGKSGRSENKNKTSKPGRKKNSIPEIQLNGRKRTKSSLQAKRNRSKTKRELPKVLSLGSLTRGGTFSPRSSITLKWEKEKEPYFEKRGTPGRKRMAFFIDSYLDGRAVSAKDFFDHLNKENRMEKFCNALITMTDIVGKGDEYRLLAREIFSNMEFSWMITSSVLAGRAKVEFEGYSDVPLRAGSMATILLAEGCKSKEVVEFFEKTSRDFFDQIKEIKKGMGKSDNTEVKVLNAIDYYLKKIKGNANTFPISLRATLADVHYTIKEVQGNQVASFIIVNLLYLRIINAYLTQTIMVPTCESNVKKYVLLSMRTLQMAASEGGQTSDHAKDLDWFKGYADTIYMEMVNTAEKLIKIKLEIHGKKKSKSKKT